MPSDSTHGQLLRQARSVAGMTVEQLSQKAKAELAKSERAGDRFSWQLDTEAIRSIERDEFKPSAFALRWFAKAMGITIGELLTVEQCRKALATMLAVMDDESPEMADAE